MKRKKTENEQIIPDDPLLEYFNKADKVLDINYQLQKEKEGAELENFKKEYNLDKLADELDQRSNFILVARTKIFKKRWKNIYLIAKQ